MVGVDVFPIEVVPFLGGAHTHHNCDEKNYQHKQLPHVIEV